MTNPDDDQLRRFLLGDLPERDREALEQRFMDVPTVFEALCALEHDLLLSYAKGGLEEPWRSAMQTRLAASESLRRELRSLRTFTSALVVPRTARRSPQWLSIAAAAALLVAASGLWLTMRPPHAVNAPLPTHVATLLLKPEQKDAGTPSVNTLRLAADTDGIALRLMIDDGPVERLTVRLRPVGGETLSIAGRLDITPLNSGLEITWTVASGQLPPGDYILTVLADGGGGPKTIAARSFSIVR